MADHIGSWVHLYFLCTDASTTMIITFNIVIIHTRARVRVRHLNKFSRFMWEKKRMMSVVSACSDMNFFTVKCVLNKNSTYQRNKLKIKESLKLIKVWPHFLLKTAFIHSNTKIKNLTTPSNEKINLEEDFFYIFLGFSNDFSLITTIYFKVTIIWPAFVFFLIGSQKNVV